MGWDRLTPVRTTRLYMECELASGCSFELDKAQVHRLTRVLRLGDGAALCVFDGRGGEYHARLTRAGHEWTVLTGDFLPDAAESPLQVTLAQCISRNERMDFTVQKAVELGVHTMLPLIAQRSPIQSPARANARVRHWRRVIIHATEQCGRTRVPVLSEPLRLRDWLTTPRHGLLLDPQAEQACARVELTREGAMMLVAGPEGGLDSAELEFAHAAGLQPVSLGPRTLRTETAALVALSILQARFGDLAH